jgi:Lon-like protease
VRRAFYAITIGVLVWAAVLVPIELFFLVEPGPATPATEAVSIEGEAEDLTGDLLITTAAFSDATAAEMLVAVVDPDRDVALRAQVVPPEIDEQEFLETQLRLFRESVEASAAVGLERAGAEVVVEGDGARVVHVQPGAPAEDVLESGDVVLEAAGEPIRLASELQAITGEAEAGDALPMVVQRGDEQLEAEAVLGPIGQGLVGLGVLVETVDQRIELPDGVDVDPRANIGGPSGGLILALTFYDLFSDEDLTDGRVIAGSGIVTLTGMVGPVGEIPKKIRGAERAGAEIFLVPAADLEVAEEAAPEGMEVIPVETVDDAIEALLGR